MPGIPSEDACFFGGTPRNYALTLQEMFDAARKDGIYPVVREGYRTYEEQQKILDDKIKVYINEGYSQSSAERTAKKWVALPGTSEHHLGIAVDINADKSNSSISIWVSNRERKAGLSFSNFSWQSEKISAKESCLYGIIDVRITPFLDVWFIVSRQLYYTISGEGLFVFCS